MLPHCLKGSVHVFDVGHMLNSPLSNVPPWKDFFLDHPFGLQFPKRGAPNPSEVFRTFFSPFFPSHRRNLWDRNFPWNMLNPPLSNFPPWKDFFWATRSAYRFQNVFFFLELTRSLDFLWQWPFNVVKTICPFSTFELDLYCCGAGSEREVQVWGADRHHGTQWGRKIHPHEHHGRIQI